MTILAGLANPSDEFMVYYSERLPWCKYFFSSFNDCIILQCFVTIAVTRMASSLLNQDVTLEKQMREAS